MGVPRGAQIVLMEPGGVWGHSMEGDEDCTRIPTQGHSTALTQPRFFFCRQNLPVPHAGLHRDLPQHAGPHGPHESALQTQPLLQVSPAPPPLVPVPHLSLSPSLSHPHPVSLQRPIPGTHSPIPHPIWGHPVPHPKGADPRSGGSACPKVTRGGRAPRLTLPVAPQV